jgi:hypothetical protein
MRVLSALFVVFFVFPALAQPSKVPPQTPAEVFTHYGLFGDWAIDCAAKASPSNPHVSVKQATGGIVETHDLGPDYAVNSYRVTEAKGLSPTRVSVDVSFQAADRAAQPQQLVFSVRGETRRTLFTKVDDGPVRVKNGVVVGYGTKTPRLKKCG